MSKLVLVLWKNAIIRRRHWFLTICEAAIPVLLFVLVAYGRSQISQIGKQEIETPTITAEQNEETIYQHGYGKQLLYAPKTPFTETLVDAVRRKLNTFDQDVLGFESEAELLNFYQSNGSRGDTRILAVVFKGDVNEKPQRLSYDVRIHERFMHWQTGELFVDTYDYSEDQGAKMYKDSGFLALQLALDKSFIEMATNKELPAITFQEFPFPPYTKDLGLQIMYENVLPLITIFSFILLCPAVIKRIVEEKYSGSKELMKMVGLQWWMLWLGWFIHAFSVSIISVTIIVILMKVPLWGATYPPIEHCDASLLAVFLLLYCAASITFCFAISAFFARPTIALIFGVLAWILSYELPSAVTSKYSHVIFLKNLFSLFPNIALKYGYDVMSKHEMRQLSLNWGNLHDKISDDPTDFSMCCVLVMLLIDCIFYAVLAFYLDAVKPGEYGLAKPWHFPISTLWYKIRGEPAQVADSGSCAKVEESAQNLHVGIRVQNLTKRYGKNMAVDGLSMDIYKDQITVLLGHNGAGKSTTMSMITGMIGATSGKILIDGRDIRRNTSSIQSSLGLCPQHNLLFTDLTVMEHLIFFGVLKGLTFSAARSEAEKLLVKMNMYEKKNSLANSLSGGMKRKLCLSMALIGYSKVLILDEPTSGMDPESRRYIWDLLLSCRGSRTILITTHFMEEADVLGDRIAIMDHGQLICYGTPMYLKKQFGTGYNLSIVRDEVNFKKDEVEEIIRRFVPSAYLKNENGNAMIYLLPNESKFEFHKLLSQLEGDKENLGISSISVSITTLEDVFLRVGSKMESKRGIATQQSMTGSITSVGSTTTSSSFSAQKVQGLFWKRWYVFRKKLKVQAPQWLIALGIVLLTVWLSHSSSSGSSSDVEEKILLDLSRYGRTKVFYDGSGDEKMQEIYGNLAKAVGSEAVKEKDVLNAILAVSLKDFMFYRKFLVVAAEFNEDETFNVMYSNFALHGVPISLNLVMNSVLKAYAGEQYSIEVCNSPLPAIDWNSLPSSWDIQIGILWLMLFPLGMFFVVAGFIIFPQQERSSNIVQLQYMCGIRAYLYWFSTFFFDLAVYCSVAFLLLFVIFIYESASDTRIFSGPKEFAALLLIFLSFGLASIPFSYLFSYKKSSAGAFAGFLMTGLFLGIVLTFIVEVLQFSGDAYYERIGKRLKYCFLLLPQFGVSYCLLHFSTKAARNHMLDDSSIDIRSKKCGPCCFGPSEECTHYKSYLSGNDLAIGNELILMAISSVLYFLLILLLESIYMQHAWEKAVLIYYKLRNRSYDIDHSDNPENGKCGISYKPLMEAKDLQKVYGNKKVVRNVSFNVKPGDCFGLLGVNGAGKSTTFRMLTGGEAATRGTVNVHTENGGVLTLNKNTSEYLRCIGYCPQNNAINQDLTGRQMLQIFAMFRGIPTGQINEEVDKLLRTLELEEFADKPCGEYSGGNKRKLCFALALIGTPPLILLDEPTSGVDAAARRKMWDMMMSVKSSGLKTSIVLTSHSMDECEALCNTLAIMKKGEIYCQDTIPRLKQQFGKGFTVLLKLKAANEPLDVVDGMSVPVADVDEMETTNLLPDDADSKQVTAVRQAIERMYKNNYVLKDKHMGLLHYHINDPKKRWSDIFREIEELKQKHPVIEDYSISETSLEDVFLSVANADGEGTGSDKKKVKPHTL